jgi:hypothetical protein
MSACAWCNEETGRKSPPGTSHGICARHHAQVMAECENLALTFKEQERLLAAPCDTLARDIARTFKDNERSREYTVLPVVCNGDLDAYIARTPGKALRDVAIGFVAGAMLLTLAVLAFHAL